MHNFGYYQNLIHNIAFAYAIHKRSVNFDDDDCDKVEDDEDGDRGRAVSKRNGIIQVQVPTMLIMNLDLLVGNQCNM
ncbi:Hypothetical predicted protein [Octopus vulgaris]|uniref:Uncharacterized protein n=1 Tax=Octopus vulgaris TaxID=6645 RepID=A0AA36FDV1_OCTVU|nr:Hypothetical predicted protein [Octopus vulgaris]